MEEDESLDVNLTGLFGRTPLYCACSNNHFSVVEKLLKHPNIDVNRKIDDNESDRCGSFGSFPLYIASSKGHLHVVRELLTIEKLDVNVRNGLEFLASLSVASQHNEIEVVCELLKHNKSMSTLLTSLVRQPCFLHVSGTLSRSFVSS